MWLTWNWNWEVWYFLEVNNKSHSLEYWVVFHESDDQIQLPVYEYT